MVTYPYVPDYVAPPGDTLLEALEERTMTQAELAQRMGRPRKTIHGIIHGKVQITPETALELERVLAIPASFWLNLEQHYREGLARIADAKQLAQQTPWLQHFPLKEMVKRRWLAVSTDRIEQLQQLLRYLGFAYPEQWEIAWQETQHAFRTARAFQDHIDSYALAVWLRQGELQSQAILCKGYDEQRFRQTLQDLRHLTRLPPHEFFPEIVRQCAAAGVAVVFVPELPHTHCCGATHWPSSKKAIIQLSLRYKTSDHLWFTLYHEAGHILLHGKTETYLECDDGIAEKELEADHFARDMLIPLPEWRRFKQGSGPFTAERIRLFAEKMQIGPDIVVGRLQHEKIIRPINHTNMLVRLIEWPIGADEGLT